MERPRPRNIIRNATIAGAVAFGGGAVAACNPTSETNPLPKPAVETLNASPELNQFETIIMNEVKRRGIEESVDEQELFQDSKELYEFNPNTSKNLTREQADNMTFDRFKNTVKLMLSSKNEDLSQKAEDIVDMVGQGFVSVAPFTSETPGAPVRFIAGFNDDGSLYAALAVDIDFTLDESDSRIFATSISQGSSAMMSALEYATSLPENLSPEEKNNRLAQFDNKKERARIYAAEAEAYIIEVGLLGEAFTVPGSEIQKRVAKYIELGMDSSNPEWIEYIENGDRDSTLTS